jgi:hypothetical protein
MCFAISVWQVVLKSGTESMSTGVAKHIPAE